MKNYTIELPNEKAKTYSYVTLFILLINCFVFGFAYFNAIEGKMKNILFIGMFISIISLIFFLLNFFTKKIPAYRVEISFFILAVCWMLLSKYLLALFLFCFAVIGIYTAKKFKVHFSKDKIMYPSFPVKTFLWSEVSNVILKDNILTIDLKNNKLIQSVIQKGQSEIDEKEFNQFCLTQLNIDR